MDHQQIIKQMIEANKATFDTTFNAINKMQDQMETLINNVATQAPWLPEDGKTAINEWASAYKTGRDGFKKTVDKNFEKVLDYFGAEK